MANVWMRCNKCGHEFQGLQWMDLRPGVQNIMIDENQESCPRPGCCGKARQMINVEVSVDEAARWRLLQAFRPTPGVTPLPW